MVARPKKPRRPSLAITLTLGALTLILGAVLGAISLISQKVEEVSKLPPPEEREPGVVYYMKGSDAPSGQWRAKRARFVAGAPGSVRLTERDLNDWSRSNLKAPVSAPRPPSQVVAAPDEHAIFGLEVEASPPNFAIFNDQLQIAAYLTFPSLSESRKFVYRVTGEFREQADGSVRFLPNSGTFGRAPVGSLPVVGEILNQQIYQLFASTEEWASISEQWGAISSVAFEDEALVVTLE